MLLVHNGKILDKEKALVKIHDPALFADFRIYETLRVEGGKVVFLQDHVSRIFNSAKVIGMNLGYNPKLIGAWINKCIQANKTDFDIYRVIIHGDVNDNKISQVYIYPEHFRQPTEREWREGLYIVTFDGTRIYPAAKTISRLTQFRATKAFEKVGAYEAILVGGDGVVHEGTRTNIFLAKDNKLITPSLKTVLPGIRRRCVIELAQQESIQVEERQVLKKELYTADEIFLTSTIMELAPVRQIDGHRLPQPRPVYKKLRAAFGQMKEKMNRDQSVEVAGG